MVNRILSTGERVLTKKSSSILSAAAIITGASLLSAVMGLLRNRLLISRFFETELLRQQLDAYWVAFRIPELVFQLLVIGAISAAFIPFTANTARRIKSRRQSDGRVNAEPGAVGVYYFFGSYFHLC
jgi:peptidoglycan biosynthesis protein MviN/MurJ (putative lipid II flippase)